MARQARLVETDVAFHITARGNYRQTVFFSDQDRAEYLELLGRHATLEELEIFGWCLMTNHTHLLAVPRQRAALARTMRGTQADYSQRLNRRIGSRCGHLWQSRFYSYPLAGDAVWTVLRYIELNPVRAQLVARAEQSSWSSAAIHCGQRAATSATVHDGVGMRVDAGEMAKRLGPWGQRARIRSDPPSHSARSPARRPEVHRWVRTQHR